jgi:glycosyltransferase involved in cell wall biosynthesis
VKICLFHPKLLPPRDYGGVERVVSWLAQGLLERGHEVWVAALAGSRLPRGAQLIEMGPQAKATDLAHRLPGSIDVVHWMAPPETGASEGLPCASILTVHGNGKPGERFPLNTVFVSRDHARRHGAEAFVHNGIDPAEYRFLPTSAKEQRLLFLSKTSWSVKNLKGALRICTQARAPLRIAGGNRPWTSRLRCAVTSRLEWAGPVGGARKADLLAQARALIFPVLWAEPFGLVVAEALISGTPVLASNQGSLPELVTPDTGALIPAPNSAEDERAWIDQVRQIVAGPPRWSAEACRDRAMTHFHYLKMAEGYENAYKRIVAGERLNVNTPVGGQPA